MAPVVMRRLVEYPSAASDFIALTAYLMNTARWSWVRRWDLSPI